VADWSNTIVVNVTLGASPPTRQGFGIGMHMVDKATNSLNGARTMSFASVDEAATAQGAGYISAGTLAALTAGFSQIPTPATIKVGNQDTAASETIAAALTAIRQADDNWYGLSIYSRADADIEAASAAIEATNAAEGGRSKIYIAQSDDASLLDAGLPAGLSTLANRERTALLYHSSDAQPGDLAWLASRLVYDPDVTSSPWEGEVYGVAAITAITSAQRDFLEANKANVGLPFSSAPYYASPGQNLKGRALYEIVSADWFKARVAEDMAYLKLSYTKRGEKLVVDSTGQAHILGILNQRLRQGEDFKHFARGQTEAIGEAITLADVQARRLRFKARAQIAADARNFVFNVFLQAEALQVS
jgi:hypothetical protein